MSPDINPSQSVDGEFRDQITRQGILAVPMSSEMQFLENNVERKLRYESLSTLCQNASMNFAASLAVALNLDKFAEIYKQAGVSMGEDMAKPVELIGNAPLYKYDKNSRSLWPVSGSDGERITLENVLVKNACGGRYGLVLEPPYAGLLTIFEGGVMCVKRLLNEQILVNSRGEVRRCNYLPEFGPLEGEALTEAINLFNNIYFDLAEKYKSSVTAILDMVPQAVGINIDPNTFHRTEYP
jgi:hypothetical protein